MNAKAQGVCYTKQVKNIQERSLSGPRGSEQRGMASGKLVTLEGVEGCGKSTQMKLLAATLKAEERMVLATAEPGATLLGKELSRLLKESTEIKISPLTELFLFLADRAQHVEEIIRPALIRGAVVLCDRYTDSTLAYQGYGRGVDLDLLKRLNELSTSGIKPDLTVVLDCDPRTGLERHGKKGAWANSSRFHLESLEFHDRIRKGYRNIAEQECDRVRLIDASGTIDEVRESIRRACKEAGI